MEVITGEPLLTAARRLVSSQEHAGEDRFAWRQEQPDAVMDSDPVVAGRC